MVGSRIRKPQQSSATHPSVDVCHLLALQWIGEAVGDCESPLSRFSRLEAEGRGLKDGLDDGSAVFERFVLLHGRWSCQHTLRWRCYHLKDGLYDRTAISERRLIRLHDRDRFALRRRQLFGCWLFLLGKIRAGGCHANSLDYLKNRTV